MIQIGLERAEQCLALQTPKEYVQQMATASEALTRARLLGKKDGAGEARGVLDELRGMLNDGDEGEAA